MNDIGTTQLKLTGNQTIGANASKLDESKTNTLSSKIPSLCNIFFNFGDFPSCRPQLSISPVVVPSLFFPGCVVAHNLSNKHICINLTNTRALKSFA